MVDEQVEKTVVSNQSEPVSVGSIRATGPVAIGALFAKQFHIEQKLGQGGMSTVYKAVDKNDGEKTVAVKTLLPHLMENEDNIKRFHREAQSISKLKHPNIVEVYAYAISDDGIPYISMEYLEGQPLSAIIKQEGRLHYERAVPILIQIAEGLAHAHATGIIHRDLKPSNVLIRDTENKKDHVGILDFGLAKFLPTGSMTGSSLTNTGEIFGSPPYMSPEQCQGSKVDQRADIYSFGCTMYEVLTGRPPLIGDTPVATVMKQITAIPAPLQEKAPDANIPPALEAICLKALAKDPAARQQMMIQIAEDLRQFTTLQTTGMEFKPLTLVEKTKLHFVQRPKIAYGVLGLAAVTVLVLFALWFSWVNDRHWSPVPRQARWAITFLAVAAIAGGGGYMIHIDRKMKKPKTDDLIKAAWIEVDSPTSEEALKISRLGDELGAKKDYKAAEKTYALAISLWDAAGNKPNRDLAFVKHAHMCSMRFKPVEDGEFSAAVESVALSFGPGSPQASAARDAYTAYLWQNHNYVSAIAQRPR